jgi:hypothetical protein
MKFEFLLLSLHDENYEEEQDSTVSPATKELF